MSISPEQQHHNLPSLEKTTLPPPEHQWDGPEVQKRLETSKRNDKEDRPRRRGLKVAIASLLALGIGGGGVAVGNHLSNSRAADAPVDEPSNNPDATTGGIVTDPTTGESSITIQTPPSSVESSAAPSGVEIAATREASIDLLAKLDTTTTPEMNEYMMSHPITQAEFPTAKDAAPALFAYLNAYENGGVSEFDTLSYETSASRTQGKQLLSVFFKGITPDTSYTDYPEIAHILQQNRENLSNDRNGVKLKTGNADALNFNISYPLDVAGFNYVDRDTTVVNVLNVVTTSNAQEMGIPSDVLPDKIITDEKWDIVLDQDTGMWKLAQDATWTPPKN